jgi:uncharacterized membrane protein YeaQ/YmgE (transglycosylase-associated protein family)
VDFDSESVEIPGLIAWILIGLAAGWIASYVMGRKSNLVVTTAIGLIGSLVGGFLFTFLGFGGAGNILGSILVATVGAVLILAIVK